MSSLSSVVWLVDDSALERQVVQRALSPAHAVESFADGPTVLERLAHGERPDVLVLDWEMPTMSGLDVCRFVRGLTAGDELPILLLTVHRDTEHIVEGLAGCGANDFVAKPFVGAELLARVGALARAKLLRDEARQAVSDRAREAEERSHLSELYMGIIGHDLRNPLGAILNATALLERANFPEAKRLQVVERIARSAQRMNEMIEQLLDVTRARLGTGLEVQPAPIDVHEICAEVAAELELANPGRVVVLEPHGDGAALADRARLMQAISNLVSNALHHGHPTEPVVVRSGDEDGETVIDVHNAGTPLPLDRLALLFDPFHRALAAPRSSPGLGLGLYITDQIVKAHGGRIEVSSATRTHFAIHLRAPAATPA